MLGGTARETGTEGDGVGVDTLFSCQMMLVLLWGLVVDNDDDDSDENDDTGGGFRWLWLSDGDGWAVIVM